MPATREDHVSQASQAVVEDKTRRGFGRSIGQIRLSLPLRTRRRIPKRILQKSVAPTRLNGLWAIVCLFNTRSESWRFRFVKVSDEDIREALATEVIPLLPSVLVIALSSELIDRHGAL